ncbi:DNA-binding transcriptional MerR regulator [Leucobacter luti]|uniref:MerR family transcriptional regulator n=1 Tax=Leucobacter luti TaxID=340320 RepID=UPI001050EA39|nr:MerR family transcriptional regulator [Leucobacter luti]MCW2289440.1 DNA-binding transcriptional MerR regulator [Leucobacter luti]TCK39999.1 DNA-binding transcriptional MerR regulator [Leucobacter luti]
MERSIQEVARAAGTTSRTLRHYDRVGLVQPSRIGSNGYRYYDDRAVVRLQRVLLLRTLGLGLDTIGEVLRAQDAQATTGDHPAAAEARILSAHLELLHKETERIAAQIGAVERTIAALQRESARPQHHGTKEDLMSENIFEGFDHAQYRDEVVDRWGENAAAKSDRWWSSLADTEKHDWMARVQQLNSDWAAAASRGVAPESAAAQELARRHIEWLRSVPGTPASSPDGDLAGYVRGLAEMYVADERFAANYGGRAGAMLVREALRGYLDRA